MELTFIGGSILGLVIMMAVWLLGFKGKNIGDVSKESWAVMTVGFGIASYSLVSHLEPKYGFICFLVLIGAVVLTIMGARTLLSTDSRNQENWMKEKHGDKC